MIDLDQLRARWAHYDRTLDACVRLNHHLLSRSALDRAQRPLGRFRRALILEIALAPVVLLLLGSFVVEHASELRFAVPGVLLAGCAAVLLRVAIVQVLLTRQIDHGQSLAASQRTLELLRLHHARWLRVVLFGAPLAWPPLAIVVLRGVFGIDAYVTPGVPWLVGNVALGLGVLGAAWWLSRRYAERPLRHPWLRWLARAFTDHHLAAAAAHLAEVAAFEDDPS